MGKYWEISLLLVPFLVILLAISGRGTGEATWLGMKVDDLDKAEAARMGIPSDVSRVIVVEVGDPALRSGVMAGDLVMGINGRKIQSVDEFLRAARWVMTSRGRDGRLPDVVITLNRMGDPLVVTVPSEQVEISTRGL